ncbi:activating transcription factor 7-interacting protein 2 isoform X2 [Trichomycterus rosablanca]|uniref:activating transcription factor 7-interacting protein 2 isoform X2 n=1 Tax=Trichomycterus rosablanca TaxID=2290929 RepID=UPI002F34F3D8
MKRKRSVEGTNENGTPSSSGKVSTSEVRERISKEVQSAMEQSDSMLKTLMDRIHEVDSEPKYDVRIKNLEMHVKKVKRRGDTVFAFIRKHGNSELLQTQVQDSLSSDPVTPVKSQNLSPAAERNHQVSSSANKGRTSDRMSPSVVEIDGPEGGSGRKPKEGFWQSLRSKKQIVDLTDDDGCRKNGTRHSDSAEPSSPSDIVDSTVSQAADGSASFSPVVSEKNINAQDEIILRLPLLPDTPFPHQLPAVALTKSMPQQPVVKVARIDNPRGIMLLWNVEKEDPDPTPMECYFIYAAQQRDDGTFNKWKTIGEIKAMPLPMACRVAASARNKTIFFVIIGKDVYGRYGPYSEICAVWGGEM